MRTYISCVLAAGCVLWAGTLLAANEVATGEAFYDAGLPIAHPLPEKVWQGLQQQTGIGPANYARTAMVLLPDDAEAAAIARKADAWKQAAQKLQAMDTALVFAGAGNVDGIREHLADIAGNTFFATDSGQALRTFLLGEPGEDAPKPCAVALIDADRKVRRMHIARQMEPGDVPRLVDEWRRGREIYMAQCARCHGPEGKDTGYPGIKTLDGLGQREDLEGIIEGTAAAGFVNIGTYPDEELRAMAVFVAGL